MAVTIKDIARKAGVSYSTVSRALNNDSLIKEETRKSITRLAKEMGYRPNALARGLVMRETNTLGLIIPDITNPFFPEVARGIEDYASEYGYTVILCNSNWDSAREHQYMDTLQSKKVDGIIIAPVSQGKGDIKKICKASVPLVFIGKEILTSTSSYVVIDNKKGGMMATEYLIKKGYRKIAFIGGIEKDSSNVARLDGYKEALRKNSIYIDKSIIKQGTFKRESGYNNMLQLIKKGYDVEAVFACNDIIALGVMQAVKEQGLTISKDVAVIGFDNIPISGYPEFSLTTIDQDKYKIGQYAVKMILNYLRGKNTSGSSIILEPKLVVRSTA